MSSLQQFREWAARQGQVSNPTNQAHNLYPGQCVSLVQQYLHRVFGVAYAPRGNAKDFVPPTFKRVTGAVKPGDIIRYGSNYGWGYGHIGLIDDDGRFLDQNGTVALRVGRRNSPFAGIESIWRPTKKLTIKTPKPAATGRIARSGTATVTASALNVRAAASTGSAVVASYRRGQSFRYDSYIDTAGFRWLSYIGNSGKRRYVAQRPLNSTVRYVTGGV